MTTNLRQRIEHGFTAFGHLVYHNHWKVLLLVLIAVGALITQMPKLKVDTSTEGFLHEKDPTLIDYNAFRAQFGRDELVVIAVTAPEIFDQSFLKKLQTFHHQLEARVPHLDDITSLVNARNTRGSAGALIVEDLLEHWPDTPQAMAELKARALANPLYRDLLLSEDGHTTTIVLKTNAYSGPSEPQDVLAGFDDGFSDSATATNQPQQPRQFLTDEENSEVVNAVEKVAAQYDGPGFAVHVAGSPVVTDVLKKAMQTNMKRFMGLALLTIGLILFLLFRRVSGVVLPLLVVVLTVVCTLGLMAATGIKVKLPTQILPSFLLAVGVGASVHLLAIFYRRLHLRANKEDAISYALGHSGLAIVMTSLTTAAGLASFSGSEVAPIADLGLMAAAGVLISLLLTLVLLPALLSVTPIKVKKEDRHQRRHETMDRALIAVADIATGRPKTILAISALVLVVGLAGATQVRFSHKPFEWLPTTEAARQATDFINDHMKGASSVEVVLDTGKENGLYDPKVLNGLDQLEQKVASIHGDELYIGKTLSVADIIKEIHQALNENRADHYKVPQDRALIAQEFLLFENSGSDDLEDFVDSGFQKARFTAKMPWVDSIYYGPLIEQLKDDFHHTFGPDAKVTVTGMIALLGRTIYAAMVSMAHSYIYAVVVITVMMILLIGDLRIGLISMIPNITPIVLTLGVMGWLGLPLDLFTMLIGSIAIGLAVDDTIHFMHNYRRYHHVTGDVKNAVRETLVSTGRAMLVTTIVLATGFFIFVFSTMSNLVNFGLLTGFTIITALLADFFLAPALMAQLHRSHLLPDDGDY